MCEACVHDVCTVRYTHFVLGVRAIYRAVHMYCRHIIIIVVELL